MIYDNRPYQYMVCDLRLDHKLLFELQKNSLALFEWPLSGLGIVHTLFERPAILFLVDNESVRSIGEYSQTGSQYPRNDAAILLIISISKCCDFISAI